MIEEREFTQKEKFEMEARLAEMRSMMNSVIPNIDDSLFSDAKVDKVYYAGGTLCIDMIFGGSSGSGLVMLNVSSETITFIVGDKQSIRLMSIPQLWFAFTMYYQVKGLTDYYHKSYNNSCIRHLYSVLMDKHDIHGISKIQNFVLEHFDNEFETFFKEKFHYGK
jgi:hypothetical protein